MFINRRRSVAAVANSAREQEHRHRVLVVSAVGIALALPIGMMTGCESLPGDEPEQGAAAGGLAGGLAGAVLGGEDNRLEGALIGAVLGAGGGYLIGQEMDKRNEEEARQAAEEARQSPATADEARDARSADLDDNGFVTVDEVIAMEQAGLSDDEMIQRLEATGQVFGLGDAERRQLEQGGVSDRVIQEMPRINRDRIPEERRPDTSGRLSEPRD